MILAIINAFTSNEKALVLNGGLILSDSCPGGIDAINAAAIGLSLSLCLEVTNINYDTDTPAHKNWTWDSIINDLSSSYLINKNHTYGCTTVLDIDFKDWEASLSETETNLEKSQLATYNLLMQKSNDNNQLYFSIVDKNVRNLEQSPQMGLHGIIEIRNGLPAISLGVIPDENVIHVRTDTSKTLAVVKDWERDNPEWRQLEEIDPKQHGLVFSIDRDEDFEDLRDDIVEAALLNMKFDNYFFDSIPENGYWQEDKNVWIGPVVMVNEGELSNHIVTFKFHGNTCHYDMETKPAK